MPADEVIIVDDCSTDNTVSFVEQYIDRYDLSTWKLIQNKTNMGWKKNFKIGFDEASGDLIFPCDQDDIWHVDKCEKMVSVMKTNRAIDLLVCNYNIFFSGQDNGSKMYMKNEKGMKNDGSLEILSIDPKWPYITRPGCTYCFRKSFYDEIKEKWNTYYPHDALLWRYARIQKKVAIYNEALIDFRRHGDNATSVKTRTKDERIQTFDDYMYFHTIATDYPLNKKELKIIEKGKSFLIKRKRVYKKRNPFLLLYISIKYYRYYLNARGILGDWFFLFRNKQMTR